jgi:hypothetical protein
VEAVERSLGVKQRLSIIRATFAAIETKSRVLARSRCSFSSNKKTDHNDFGGKSKNGPNE